MIYKYKSFYLIYCIYIHIYVQCKTGYEFENLRLSWEETRAVYS